MNLKSQKWTILKHIVSMEPMLTLTQAIKRLNEVCTQYGIKA